MRLKVGLLGIGKIARDQHIPSLRANPRFELAACASRNATVDGVANFPDLEAMLTAVPGLHCISICTPPQAHFDAALTALRAGKHVMLEKPPAATTRQIALLADEAATDHGNFHKLKPRINTNGHEGTRLLSRFNDWAESCLFVSIRGITSFPISGRGLRARCGGGSRCRSWRGHRDALVASPKDPIAR